MMIERRCKNPHCSKTFQYKAFRAVKKYCCSKCRNDYNNARVRDLNIINKVIMNKRKIEV